MALHAQNYKEYYQLTTIANTHFVQKEYNEAIDKFNTAFDKFYPFIEDLQTLKKCYIAIGDKENAYQTLCKMVLCGYKIDDTTPIIYHNNHLLLYNHNGIDLYDTLLEQRFFAEYPQLRSQYESRINTELNKYLEACVSFEVFCGLARSQTSSTKEMRIIANAGFNVEKIVFMNLMKEKDIPRYEVSAWTNFNLLRMVLHTAQSATKKDFEEYFKLLWKQVEEGNFILENYASIFDNCYNRVYGKDYFYGGQSIRKKDGKVYMSPVEDVKNVDERRAKIGLPPLWVWCKKYNLVPPEGYNMPEE
jgi:tetratricopeptide (TPR) repeat protein